MVSNKKNFPQQNRINRQNAMPYKKPPPMNNFNNNPMFNVSQIPDLGPGYLDFNLPTPPNSNNSTATNGNNNNVINKNGNSDSAATTPKKKNNKNKQKNINNKPQGGNNPLNNNVVWKNTNQNQQGGMGGGPNNRFNGGGPRNFVGNQMLNRRGNRMMPPMVGPRGMGMGPMPPMGFQPPPMMPPPMPMGGRGGPPMPMGGPPPFMRRGNGPMPPPIPPMMMPRMPPANRMPPAPFIAGVGGKIKKNKPIPKKVAKGNKSTIKTLKNLINQYPIDKPWVSDEIRQEHDKKVDIENRLKGNKDDDLFAQFKVQRDKFVSMYEAAREEYLKKEAAAVKAKDEKDKQTNTNTAKKDDKKEANSNENKKKN